MKLHSIWMAPMTAKTILFRGKGMGIKIVLCSSLKVTVKIVDQCFAAIVLHDSIYNNFLCFQIHMVHWYSKYSNYADAVRKPDGVAILAILIQVSLKLLFLPHIYYT